MRSKIIKLNTQKSNIDINFITTEFNQFIVSNDLQPFLDLFIAKIQEIRSDIFVGTVNIFITESNAGTTASGYILISTYHNNVLKNIEIKLSYKILPNKISKSTAYQMNGVKQKISNISPIIF